MSSMAADIAARMRADGVDVSQTPDAAMGGAPASGTGEPVTPQAQAAPPAGAQNTDTQPGGGEPGPIPYSRFAEVNTQLQGYRERYGVLEQYGIEPDSAVRLASFEAAYMEDPTGTIASMVDQLDLPDSRKGALKELLTSQAVQAGPDPTVGAAGALELPPEVKEAVEYVRQRREADVQAESNARLNIVVDHWKAQDEQDGVKFSDRQRLQYVSTAAAQGGFQTLEQLSEAARAMALDDRDTMLGAAVSAQRPRTGTPLAVPAGGVPPTLPIAPKSMAEARKLIEADIAAGRLPDLAPGG